MATAVSGNYDGEPQIEETVYYHLEYFAYDDAISLAELYHQRVHNNESLYLFAQCMLKSGRLEAAYKLLNTVNLKTALLRYLYAHCCYNLNKSKEAELALRMDSEARLHPIFEGTTVKPFAHSLLAKIFMESERTNEAKAENRQAIERNKLSWSSLKMHCDLGAAQEVEALCTKLARQACKANDIFQKGSSSSSSQALIVPSRSPEKRTPLTHDAGDIMDEKAACMGPKKPRTSVAGRRNSELGLLRRRLESGRELRRSSRLMQDSENFSTAADNLRRITRSRVSGTIEGVRSLPDKQLRSVNRLNEAEVNQLVLEDTSSSHSTPLLQKIFDTPKIPESSTKQKSQSKKTGHRIRNDLPPLVSHDQNSLHESPTADSPAPSALPAFVPMPRIATSQARETDSRISGLSGVTQRIESVSRLLDDSTKWTSIFVDIVEKVACLGRVQSHLSRYSIAKALKYFNEMPEHCSTTPIGREMLAHIFFEKLEYSKAREILERLHLQYPYHLSGMEVLSTALWHEQDSRQLSTLSAELTESARNYAETWCVAGNCFSVQKQHETAIECFERAVKLQPRFSYAYTLLGHELLDTDQLDKAASSFRRALCLCPIDYRAWFGLGLLHFKREHITWARYYLKRAVSINGNNSVLLCQLSLVEQALHNNNTAMELLNQALRISPDNAACCFYRARLLYEMREYEECRVALNDLKLFAHDEAQVFFLLGRVYKKLNNTHLALLNFSWAAEMDPRGEQNQTSRSEATYDEDPDAAGGH